LAGRRTLDTEADDCGPLGEAVILAVAIVIDPSAAMRPPGPVAPPTPTPAAPVPAAPPPAPCPANPPCPVAPPCPSCPTNRDRVDVLARAVAVAGILPKAAIGPGLSGVYSQDPLQLTASLGWVPDVAASDGRFAFGFAFAGVGACYRLSLGASSALAGCSEVDVGAVHGAVLDVNQLTSSRPSMSGPSRGSERGLARD
jgi:hypothetical protein